MDVRVKEGAISVVRLYLIIDVDRPRRGFVTIGQKPMTDLQATLRR